MDFETIRRVELSYWLSKYIGLPENSIEKSAQESGVSVEEIKKALSSEMISRQSTERLCAYIDRPYESLSIPPTEELVFWNFAENLQKEYYLTKMGGDRSQVNERLQKMRDDYSLEDIERISAWLRYLVSNPDSPESRDIVEPIMDMEEQVCNRAMWRKNLKGKAAQILAGFSIKGHAAALAHKGKPTDLEKLTHKIDEAEKNK